MTQVFSICFLKQAHPNLDTIFCGSESRHHLQSWKTTVDIDFLLLTCIQELKAINILFINLGIDKHFLDHSTEIAHSINQRLVFENGADLNILHIICEED